MKLPALGVVLGETAYDTGSFFSLAVTVVHGFLPAIARFSGLVVLFHRGLR
jgi:hypothetical protein